MRRYGLVLCAASAVWGQGGSIGFTPPSARPEAIRGAPYSGEEEWVTPKGVIKGRVIYRDSEGRVRTERLLMPGDKRAVVEIIDPVLGGHWVLDTQHKVAHLMMPQPPPPPSPPAPSPHSVEAQIAPPAPQQQPKVTTEQLEPRTIDEIAVVGSRSTTVYPGGRTVLGETWYSPDLRILVWNRMGDETFRIARLSKAEPLPSLFRPPADYTVIEEKTTFVVEYR